VLDGKTGVPADLTGNDGSYVDKYVAKVLREEYWGAPYNVAVRLGPDVIGIDVDAYDAKRGAETIEEALDGAWLPETFRTSARGWDSLSGIYLYRLAEPARWPTNFGPGSGVEVIQRHHRYAMVGPSVHPGLGNPYQWLQGNSVVGIPRVVDIPVLPAAVRVKLLTYMALHGQTASDAQDWAGAEDGLAWLAGGGDGEGPCHRMSTALGVWLDKLGAAHGGTRHDTMIAAQLNLCRLRKEGHPGLHEALSTLYAEWQLVMAGESRGVVAEFGRSLGRPLHEALEAAGEESDPCDVPEALYESLGEDVLLEDDELSPAVPAVAKVREKLEQLEQKKLAAQVVTAVVVEPAGQQVAVSTGPPVGPPGESPPSWVSQDPLEPVWRSHEIWAKVKQAAEAEMAGPKATFLFQLARLSSMIHHERKFRSGFGGIGTPNLFVVLAGDSADGKSILYNVARGLIKTPARLRAEGAFYDGIGLGSGEGVAESVMGKREIAAGAGAPAKVVREQVRYNVFFNSDEAEAIFKAQERKASTTMAYLRAAWSGSTIGQANASQDTTRLVPAGMLHTGLVLYLQPHVARHLAAEVGLGTPQRFLYGWVNNPFAPALGDLPNWPGEGFIDLEGGPANCPGIVTFAEEITRELREWRQEKLRAERGRAVDMGSGSVSDFDSHKMVTLCKIAVVMVLAVGREHVGAEDWELAKLVWSVSCQDRDDLLHLASQYKIQESDEKKQEFADRAVAAHVAVKQAPNKVTSCAQRLVALVGRKGPCTRRDLQKGLGRDGSTFVEPALLHALREKWLVKIQEDGGAVRYGLPEGTGH